MSDLELKFMSDFMNDFWALQKRFWSIGSEDEMACLVDESMRLSEKYGADGYCDTLIADFVSSRTLRGVAYGKA